MVSSILKVALEAVSAVFLVFILGLQGGQTIGILFHFLFIFADFLKDLD